MTSVVFGDLVGFTSLSETRDSEEVRELLSRYFAAARVIVQRYGGTVEKFIGDAVMAVWGVPRAHEDDAERAVRAGLELVESVRALGADIAVPELAMRVGVVTGEVAVTIGATGEGMVAGDAVNTASRVQSEAAPGRVWVDERTRLLTAASVTYNPVGERLLKGKSEPIALFEAGSVVASLGGGDRVDGLESALVGRDRELRLVKELFHGTDEAGRPCVLVLQGEAGVGKSRLAWEFEKYVDGLSATVLWHRGRCLSYGEGVAFWALSEAVRVRLGLVEGDSGAVLSERLEAALERYVSDEQERDWLRPRMAVLVGTTTAENSLREELFSAWVTFFERVGSDGPVVLVIDDAQYADEALLDFFEHLLAVARFGIFVALLSRTGLIDRRPSLATRRGTTILHLEPLSDTDMGRLLDGLVVGLPQTIRTRLVERAEGVPLFAVETVRALIDRDLVVARGGHYVLADPDGTDLREVGAPASLQALVSARLDSLTTDERRVVADASVLGLSFTRDGIAALADPDADPEAALGSLVRKQILSVQSDRFSSEFGRYRFVQAVVRQVAYEMLSRRDRKARHLAVAAHIAAQPDPSDSMAGVLAQHYLDAVDAAPEGDPQIPALVQRGTGLLARAAVRARSLGAHAEAERHLEEAIRRSEESAELAGLYERSAAALRDQGRWQQALERAEMAAAAYEGIGDEVGVARSLAIQGRALVSIGQNAEAVRLLQPVWDSLAQHPDTVPALLAIAASLGAAFSGLADSEAVSRLGERRILLAESTGDVAELAEAMVALGSAYWTRGAPFAGRVLMQAGATIAQSHGITEVATRALVNLAAEALPRDVAAAIEYGREGVASAIKTGVIGWISVASANRSLALWTAGRWGELRTHLDSLDLQNAGLADRALHTVVELWLADAAGTAGPTTTYDLDEAESDDEQALTWVALLRLQRHAMAGERGAAAAAGAQVVERALRVAELTDDFMHHWPRAVIAAIEAGDVALSQRLLAPVEQAPPGLASPALLAQLPRLHGLLAVSLGTDSDAATRHLTDAIAALDAYGAVPDRARTQEELGTWLRSVGREDEAVPLLEAARETYAELGAWAWLKHLDPSALTGR
ncbi:MAG: adenylate/guanylate cyclase domain-containing protein [Candidatus Nanopelagicales bacterium]